MRLPAAPTVAASGAAIVFTVTAGHFFNDAFTALLSPLGPALQERFDTSIGSIALLAAVLSLTSSVLQPLLGIWGERFDRRLMAALGPALAGVGLSLMGHVPSFALVVLLVAIGGLGSGIFHPASSAFVAQYSPADKRGLWASLFSAGGTAGMALGPLFAGTLGLDGLPWLIPIGLVIGALTYIIAPPTYSSGKRHGWREYTSIFRGPMVTLWLMAVLRSLASTGYNGLLPFLLKERGFGVVEAGWALAVYSVASAVGGIVGGRLSDKYGRTRVLRSSILATIPLFALLVFSSPAQWWYYPLTFLVGAMVNASIPVGVVTAQEYAPRHVAVASSIMMGFSWGTAGILFWFIGELADVITPARAMLVAIAMLLPSVWLAYRLPEPGRVAFDK
ncbi:FSR family fosmidomycin resistance protein-like MFS transporter [Deinobacterium chartae]|uniref:FSR family fosmidomycin resistance protein-like MFS transporter n=1 Tax=Deinobacterium chartae TaxID=521158 RepID=A0A841HZA7_9DEIO|nr:MFS transporter [Deinobacterium chartae]MBB6098273.1 FSR family fosmidomycin resistance protein-like MFS transporter [Deinobacterium chartae]